MPFILLGDILKEEKNYEESIKMYQKAHDGGMIGKEFCYYRLAVISAINNNKEKTINYLTRCSISRIHNKSLGILFTEQPLNVTVLGVNPVLRMRSNEIK